MAMANQNNIDTEFEPRCWRYVTVRDFRNEITDEAFTQSGLRGLAEDKIVAKLQWSRQAWPVVLPWDPLSDSGVTTESGLSGLGE